jgi:hypothetical protein
MKYETVEVAQMCKAHINDVIANKIKVKKPTVICEVSPDKCDYFAGKDDYMVSPIVKLRVD